MFPKDGSIFRSLIEEKPSDWNNYKSFLSVSPEVIKFYQVIKTILFQYPCPKRLEFISSERKKFYSECIYFILPLEKKPWDIPLSSFPGKIKLNSYEKQSFIIMNYQINLSL